MAAIAFKAHNDQVLQFPIPRGVNRYLVTKAIERLHRGEDADLVGLALTRKETEFVAEVAAALDERRAKPARG